MTGRIMQSAVDAFRLTNEEEFPVNPSKVQLMEIARQLYWLATNYHYTESLSTQDLISFVKGPTPFNVDAGSLKKNLREFETAALELQSELRRYSLAAAKSPSLAATFAARTMDTRSKVLDRIRTLDVKAPPKILSTLPVIENFQHTSLATIYSQLLQLRDGFPEIGISYTPDTGTGEHQLPNCLYVLTEPVTLYEAGPGSASFDFGAYVMRVTLPKPGHDNLMADDWNVRGNLRVRAVEPRLSNQGFFHTNVNTSGSVCTGEGSSAMDRAGHSCLIYNVFNLCNSILNTYGVDNPYNTLSTWLSAQSRAFEYEYRDANNNLINTQATNTPIERHT